MKKVGLLLANPITNYGAHLQAFATQYVIDNLGIETEIINRTPQISKRTYFDLGYFVYLFKKRFNSSKKTVELYDDEFKQIKIDRTRLAKEFRKARLHDERSFQSYNDLVEHTKSYSAVLIGSDQLWSPGAAYGSINSLRFVPKGVDRVSYATSLGVSYYPRYCWRAARDMWKHMDSISVREEQGAAIIREICNNEVDVKVVADPTYLMSKEEWEKVIPVKKMCDKRYVFCYFLGNNKESKLCAQRYAKQHNLYLVSILSCESFSDIDRTFADENVGLSIGFEVPRWFLLTLSMD